LVELHFSVLQRKVLTPNDLCSIDDLVERIRAFGERYSALGMPFAWTFTRHELEQRLRDPLLNLQPSTSPTGLLDRPRYFRDAALGNTQHRVVGRHWGTIAHRRLASPEGHDLWLDGVRPRVRKCPLA